MSGSGRKLGSSNFLNQQRLAEACVANEVFARISLRWKMSVLYSIDTGARSFAELKRVHPTLSDHILAALFLKRFTADLPWIHVDLSASEALRRMCVPSSAGSPAQAMRTRPTAKGAAWATRS